MRIFKFSHDYDNYYKVDELIEICFKHTSFFTLTEQTNIIRQIPDNEMILYRKFEKELKPFLVKKFDTTKWYCYYVTEQNKLTIDVYKFNEETKRILNSYIDNLFFEAKNKRESLNMPMDICFFRKNKTLFLGTVSHESIASFYLSDQEYNKIKLPAEFVEVDKPLSNFDITLPI